MKTIGSRIQQFTSAALLVLAAGGIAATARGAEPATWKDQDLVLDYMGFTTHYSCDGLRDRVRTVLLQLGARPDLTVTSSGCTRTGGGPERFPSVRAHFATLQPAADAASGAASAPQAAPGKT